MVLADGYAFFWWSRSFAYSFGVCFILVFSWLSTIWGPCFRCLRWVRTCLLYNYSFTVPGLTLSQPRRERSTSSVGLCILLCELFLLVLCFGCFLCLLVARISLHMTSR